MQGKVNKIEFTVVSNSIACEFCAVNSMPGCPIRCSPEIVIRARYLRECAEYPWSPASPTSTLHCFVCTELQFIMTELSSDAAVEPRSCSPCREKPNRKHVGHC